jgi:hypothetical protein
LLMPDRPAFRPKISDRTLPPGGIIGTRREVETTGHFHDVRVRSVVKCNAE